MMFPGFKELGFYLDFYIPWHTKVCRLCNGEPFIEWFDKDKPHTRGATHHTCYPGEELGTLMKVLTTRYFVDKESTWD